MLSRNKLLKVFALISMAVILISIQPGWSILISAKAEQNNQSIPTYDASALPICNISNPVDPSKITPPNAEQMFAPAVCQTLKTIKTVVNPNSISTSRAPNIVGTITPDTTTAQAYAWATNVLSCQYANNCTTSSGGVNFYFFDISSQIPTIPTGYSWYNYHFYNRTHIGNPAYPSSGACGSIENISFGIAYGNVNNNVWSNRLIDEIQTSQTNQICTVNDGGITVNPPGALTVRMLRNGTNWEGDAWLGYWSTIFSTPTNWSYADYVESGQEIEALNGDLNTINVPVNFYHKAEFAGTNNSIREWSDFDLVSPLYGITHSLPAINVAPLQVMDGSGGDYTSMASHNIH